MNSNEDYSDNDSLNTIISGDNNNDYGNELEECNNFIRSDDENELEEYNSYYNFTRTLSVEAIKFYLEFQEYPCSLEKGFASVRCIVEQRTCQGVKVCKLASPEIINYQHSNVNFEDSIFEKTFQNNELTSQEITLCQYVAAFKINCKFVFHGDNNEEIQCDGKPTLKYHFQMVDGITIKKYFIGCQKWKRNEVHRYIPISDS
ncbi:6319_t:CDS:2, partial [Entrophospora sp. SA101]